MILYARLRPRLTKLTLPIIWLALISAGVSFASTYELEDWLRYTVYTVAGVLAILLWGLPSLSFAAKFIDVRADSITLRTGFGSKRQTELSLGAIAEVRSSSMQGIVIRTKDEREFTMRGYANQKAIVAELNRMILGK